YPSPIRCYTVVTPIRPIPPILQPLALGTGTNRQLSEDTPSTQQVASTQQIAGATQLARASARTRVLRPEPQRSTTQRSTTGFRFGVVCVAIAISVGGAIAFSDSLDTHTAPPPSPVVAMPIIAPVRPAPVATPIHVTVRLESQPIGAQALLI